MNRTTRSVAAAALAGVVALGAVAPAVAAPPDGVGKPDKVAAKAEKQQTKVDKREAKAALRLERMANRKAGYLDRLATSAKVARIDAMVEEDLVLKIRNDANDIREAEELADVRSVRPVVYHRILNQIRLVVVNELEPTLLAKVLDHDVRATKAELKATQLEIAAELEEAEGDEDPAGEGTTDVS